VLRLVLTLEGETVLDCSLVIGYLHRGIEKTLENRPYMGGIRYLDNADYLSPMLNEIAYAGAIESSKGELGVYLISDGSEYPWRAKLRGPSFVNPQVLPELLRGYKISDVIAVLGSLDFVVGEVDR